MARPGLRVPPWEGPHIRLDAGSRIPMPCTAVSAHFPTLLCFCIAICAHRGNAVPTDELSVTSYLHQQQQSSAFCVVPCFARSLQYCSVVHHGSLRIGTASKQVTAARTGRICCSTSMHMQPAKPTKKRKQIGFPPPQRRSRGARMCGWAAGVGRSAFTKPDTASFGYNSSGAANTQTLGP